MKSARSRFCARIEHFANLDLSLFHSRSARPVLGYLTVIRWAGGERSVTRLASVFVLLVLLIANVSEAWVGSFTTADGWHWRNPLPFAGNFYCVAMLSENSIVIGGSYGVIIYSDDQGENWSQARVPADLINPVRSLAFIPQTAVGFAVSEGRLLKTEDAGHSWSYLFQIEGYGQIYARDLCSVDGYVYLLMNPSGNARNVVLWWDNVEDEWIQPFQGGNNFVNLKRIKYPYCWNDSLIFCWSDSIMFDRRIGDVEPVPEGDSFVYIQDTTLRAGDGRRLSGFERRPTDICFSDADNLYVVSTHLFRSRDGGRHFEDLGDLNYFLHRVEFFNEEVGFVVGELSRALYTINSGNFWSNSIIYRSEFSDLRNIYFVNDTLGFMQTSNCEEPMTYRTGDGGRIWTQIALSRRDLPNINKFWVHPAGQYIFALDGTGLFTRMIAIDMTAPQSIDEGVRDFMFLDNDHGWYITDTKIFATSTGGLFWTSVSELEGDSLRSIFFTSLQDGYVAGKRGRILRTNNSGARWNDVSVAGVDVNALWFFDANTGYAAGNEGVFFKTNDGGIHWRPRRTDNDDDIHCIRFWDEDHGYLVISDGLLTTEDSGLNFRLYRTPLGFAAGHEQKTASVIVRDRELTKFIYARGSCILEYDVNEAGLVETPPLTPGAFELLTSYPNPFNGRVYIQYRNLGPTERFVNVYDLCGRLTDRLALPPAAGEGLLSWDAKGLPSGSYILLLEQPGAVSGTRIVLLR